VVRQVAVARRQVAGGERVETAGDVGQLAIEDADAGQLVGGRRAFIGIDRAIELVGEFAQAFLAGDRAAFLGGDDLLAQSVGLC
jgi:hypothetical protein